MSTLNILMGIQLVLTVLLVITIIPQETKKPITNQEGSQAYFKPKGRQAFLNRATIVLVVLFFINALVMLKVK